MGCFGIKDAHIVAWARAIMFFARGGIHIIVQRNFERGGIHIIVQRNFEREGIHIIAEKQQ